MMRKPLKTLLIMVLVAILLVPASITAFAAEIWFGMNVIGELNEDTGYLEVSGTGPMFNWDSYKDSPMYMFDDEITSVVIKPGVTTVGSYAFNYAGFIESVTIPGTVVSIGEAAFKDCESLAVIKNYFEGQQEIGDGAFHSAGPWAEEKIAYCYPSNTTFAAAAAAAGYTVMDIQYAPADPEEPGQGQEDPEQPQEGLPSYPDMYVIDAENDTAYIYGVVDPAVLSAEVTLSTFFHIAPNAPEGERFISPDITITNTSTMPIYVDAVALNATGDAPKVVAHNKYSDDEWSRLGVADTAANIALGLTGAPTAGSFFFAAEENQAPVRLDDNLLSQEADSFGLQAKFGLSWPKAETFRYDLTLAIGLRD